MRSLLSVAVLSLLAACGSHPLAGTWAQELPNGKQGITLQFEIGASRMLGHCHVDGACTDILGTYEFDEAENAVTMTVTENAALLGCEAGGQLAGKVDGDQLEVGSADGKLTFHRTDQAAGH